MRTTLVLAFICFSLFAQAQETSTSLLFKKVPIPGYAFDILVKNTKPYVMSYKVKFDVYGYKTDNRYEFTDTIGPGVEKKIMHLEAKRRIKNRDFTYSWVESIGNFNTKHDLNLKYYLPYEEGKAFKVIQAYDEGNTHKTIEAIDFAMPTGTKVTVARRGLVVDIKQDSTNGCPDESCASDANFVQVLHYDGTFAKYQHLQAESVLVKLGQYVNIGDVLALSGATGQVSEPQLHFEVQRLHPNLDRYVTVPVKFTVNDENKSKILEVGDTFTRPKNIQ
ncbi:M23 family metallopeptidase [Croceibacter atlanticus]|jgi:murein DD-endopeptidase MepM/ murein hydrolase activator NlpD|uniref:M23 family metallopeptidase n=1 Tax=Croceibacter atlanticus TaxID=313588 RepID=UPI0024B923F5|nr:M23 family metallopeptidase [Croceibacter atlanticus]